MYRGYDGKMGKHTSNWNFHFLGTKLAKSVSCENLATKGRRSGICFVVTSWGVEYTFFDGSIDHGTF